MQDSRKPRFGPKSLFSAIYDWVNTCDSIPNFDGVLISFIVFIGGCLLMGYCFVAGSLSKFRHQPAVHPTLVHTTKLLNSADVQVEARFGQPRAGVADSHGTRIHYSPQELFGQASAAPVSSND